MTNAPDNTAAYRSGYEKGFEDGQQNKPKKYRLSLLKALASDEYRRRYTLGYKQGHFDGSRKLRQAELKAMQARNRIKTHEREGVTR